MNKQYELWFLVQPLEERLPFQTPKRPQDITFTTPDSGRLTTPVQEHGQLESPHLFLSPVDKGVYIINSTLGSSQVSMNIRIKKHRTVDSIKINITGNNIEINSCIVDIGTIFSNIDIPIRTCLFLLPVDLCNLLMNPLIF